MKKFIILTLTVLSIMWLYTTAQNRNGLVLTDTQAAIDYMYANGLTKFSTTTSFMADSNLRRDEAAAFFARFARDVLGIVPDTTKAECNNFVDLYLWHQDLVGEMIAACQLWLIKGSNGKFMPRDTFSNAHAVTVIVRLLDGDQPETGPHRGSNYLNRARTIWLTNGLNIDRIGIASDWSNLDKSITRGDVAKLIEAWSVQWLGLKNIDYTQQWTANCNTANFIDSDIWFCFTYPNNWQVTVTNDNWVKIIKNRFVDYSNTNPQWYSESEILNSWLRNGDFTIQVKYYDTNQLCSDGIWDMYLEIDSNIINNWITVYKWQYHLLWGWYEMWWTSYVRCFSKWWNTIHIEYIENWNLYVNQILNSLELY